MPRSIEPGDLRRAAVLVPLRPRSDGAFDVILTKRHAALSAHAGQIAFPGGRIDAADATVEAAALREAHEEIGLAPEAVRIVGRLDDLVTVTHYHITPVVGVIPSQTAFAPNPGEVERVLAVPLPQLLDAGRWEQTPHPYRGAVVRIWQFTHAGDVIWGATGSMLHGMTEIVRGAGL
ncbi:MAG TPA: CoA pyrophosphatase [Myxococcota bacterium]|nr:CoA pyrophosphatase [Myxococcota bacterium]